MLQNDDYVGHDDDHDNTVAGAEGDEEAQLLRTETLDFEDNVPLHSQSKNRSWRACRWLHGPHPYQPQRINPIFTSIQQAPVDMIHRLAPRKHHRVMLLIGSLLLWFLIFIFFLRSQLPIQDSEGKDILNLDCVDSLWKPKNKCGLDGIDCRPFTNDSFTFRCPAKCAGVQVLNPHPVGPLDVNYRPFVIGDNPYRGDSFLCGAAIHAGLVTDTRGGCGKISRIGRHDDFPAATKHGLESIAFDSYFPLSFNISEDFDLRCSNDPRQILLFVSLTFTTMLSLFTPSPAIFFPIFTMIFAHVGFVSDPPSASYLNVSVVPDHLSKFAKRLLPALFCAVVIYWSVVKRSLSGLAAHIEKTVLWLGGFWLGALSNYTFEWIPISRLTAHDIQQQPGAKVALVVILVILVCIIAQQIYYFWLEGRLLRYLALYGLFIFGILVCLVIPGVQLRLHHYIIALLLLPGTSIQTRPSILYQGILLGLFVNGIARWDFDSLLQTARDLRGDGAFNSALPVLRGPFITSGNGGFVASFSWAVPPTGVDGISAMVNDVERYRSFYAEASEPRFEWRRSIEQVLPEYFRFAYVKGGQALDYTKAGTLFINGTFRMVD